MFWCFLGLAFLGILGLTAFEVVRVLSFEGFGLSEAASVVLCSIGSLSRILNAAICSIRNLSRAANVVLCSNLQYWQPFQSSK